MSEKILTQDELNALMPAAAGDRPADAVLRYDFCRPDRVTKDELRSLHFLHDRFAVNVSTSLSAYLRAATEISVVSAEQMLYSEFLLGLPDSTAFYKIDIDPMKIAGALEICPAIAFTVVDRMLGGTGTAGPNRPLTEIELNVVDTIVKVLMESLTETWKPIIAVQFRMRSRETRPQVLQIADHNEVMVLLMFDMRLGDVHGTLRLCVPAAAFEGMVEMLAPGGQRARRDPSPAEEAWLHANLGRVPLDLTAQLEMSLPARDLVMLRPGDVLALPHAASKPVGIRVAQLPRFTGRLARSANDSIGIVIEGTAGEFEETGA